MSLTVSDEFTALLDRVWCPKSHGGSFDSYDEFLLVFEEAVLSIGSERVCVAVWEPTVYVWFGKLKVNWTIEPHLVFNFNNRDGKKSREREIWERVRGGLK